MDLVGRASEEVHMFDQLDADIVEYAIGGHDVGPYGITATADGSICFTMVHAGAIGRLDVTGELRTVPLNAPESGPMVITEGPDGAVWFTENTANAIGRMELDGRVISIATPTPAAAPFGITVGPDRAVWFTEGNADAIGRVDPATHEITEYPIPSPGGFPSAITTGTDGALVRAEPRQRDRENDRRRRGDLHPLPTAGTAPVGVTTGPTEQCGTSASAPA